MKCLLIILIGALIFGCAQNNNSGQPLLSDSVFGELNLKEGTQKSLLYGRVVKATAAMVKHKLLIDYQNGIMPPVLGEGVKFADDENEMFKEAPLCADNPLQEFFNQPVVATCSAFLVAPDMVLTAGHCIKYYTCDGYSFLFDFQKDKIESNLVDWSKLYSCAEVVEHVEQMPKPIYDPEHIRIYEESLAACDDVFTHPYRVKQCRDEVVATYKPKAIDHDYSVLQDYALVRLDRQVTDRKPLRIRKRGEIKPGEKLVVIGHPVGLPTKISKVGEVVHNQYKYSFQARIDSFHGNSGALVYNVLRRQVEGILNLGEEPFLYDPSGDCVHMYERPMDTEDETILTTVTKIMGVKALYKK